MIDTIIQGDCLEVMRDMPDESIDLVVTSPPYDNLRTYDDMCEWNFDIFKSIATELYRLIKIGGVIVWVVGDATINGSETGTSFKQALYFKDIGFNLHDTMIYKKNSLTFPDDTRYYQSFEYMFIFSKDKPKTFNPIKDRANKWAGTKLTGTSRQKDGSLKPFQHKGKDYKDFGVRFNIWEYNVGLNCSSTNPIAHQHPAIFPEKLAKDQILSWSNEYDLILDPFMGSGTTAIACIETNRHYIGIEINPDYCEIANKRISNNKEQLKIF